MGAGCLLVVALEFLWLVVAAGLTFPRTVEEAVCRRGGIFIELVIPCGRLTVAALSS